MMLTFGILLALTGCGHVPQTEARYPFLSTYPPFQNQSLTGPSLLPFKHSQEDIQRTINRVVLAIRSDDISLDDMQERSVAGIATKVKQRVAQALETSSQKDFTKFEQDWMLAEGVSEYVRWNVYFDPALTTIPEGSKDQAAYATHSPAQYLLDNTLEPFVGASRCSSETLPELPDSSVSSLTETADG